MHSYSGVISVFHISSQEKGRKGVGGGEQVYAIMQSCACLPL